MSTSWPRASATSAASTSGVRTTVSAASNVKPPVKTETWLENGSLPFAQEVVRPVDRAPQRLVAFEPRPAAPRPAPGCRPAAGRPGPPPARLAGQTAKPGAPPRPLDEQPHRLVLPPARPRRRRRVGQRQRRDAPGDLAGDAERLPAGGQDAQAGAGRAAARRPGGRRRRAGARSCPAPAAGAWAQGGGQRRVERRPGCSRTPDPQRRTPAAPAPGRPAAPARPARRRPGRRPASAATCRARRVLPHPPAPVSVSSRSAPSSRRDLGQLPLAPDEAGQLAAAGCAAARPASAAGGKSAGRSGCSSWKTRSGPDEVAQPVLAQVAQAGPGRQGVAHQLGRRLGEQHLPPVGRRQQPGAAVEAAAADSSRPAARHLAGVQRHPHPQRRRSAPQASACSARCAGQRGGHGASGARAKAAYTASPHRLEDTPRRAPRPPRRRGRGGRRPRIAAGCASHRRGAALQVGEQEGDPWGEAEPRPPPCGVGQADRGAPLPAPRAQARGGGRPPGGGQPPPLPRERGGQAPATCEHTNLPHNTTIITVAPTFGTAGAQAGGGSPGPSGRFEGGRHHRSSRSLEREKHQAAAMKNTVVGSPGTATPAPQPDTNHADPRPSLPERSVRSAQAWRERSRQDR